MYKRAAKQRTAGGEKKEHAGRQRIAGQNEGAGFPVIGMIHQISCSGDGRNGNDGEKTDVPGRFGKADTNMLDPALGDPCHEAKTCHAEAKHAQAYVPLRLAGQMAGRVHGRYASSHHPERLSPLSGTPCQTLALQNDVDVKTVSSMLGHYDAGFTLRTYTHATRQMQDEAAQTMGNFMAQAM